MAAHPNIQPARCVRTGGKYHDQRFQTMLPNTTVDVTLPFKVAPLLIDYILYIMWTENTAACCENTYLLAEMGLERYKFVVQVVIGEQRGEGVK